MVHGHNTPPVGSTIAGMAFIEQTDKQTKCVPVVTRRNAWHCGGEPERSARLES